MLASYKQDDNSYSNLLLLLILSWHAIIDFPKSSREYVDDEGRNSLEERPQQLMIKEFIHETSSHSFHSIDDEEEESDQFDEYFNKWWTQFTSKTSILLCTIMMDARLLVLLILITLMMYLT